MTFKCWRQVPYFKTLKTHYSTLYINRVKGVVVEENNRDNMNTTMKSTKVTVMANCLNQRLLQKNVFVSQFTNIKTTKMYTFRSLVFLTIHREWLAKALKRLQFQGSVTQFYALKSKDKRYVAKIRKRNWVCKIQNT